MMNCAHDLGAALDVASEMVVNAASGQFLSQIAVRHMKTDQYYCLRRDLARSLSMQDSDLDTIGHNGTQIITAGAMSLQKAGAG